MNPETQTCLSEETCSQSVKLDNDEIVEAPTATQRCTRHCDADVKVGYSSVLEKAKHTGVSWHTLNMHRFFFMSCSSLKANVGERDSVELNEAKKNPKSEERFPVLSFAVSWEK